MTFAITSISSSKLSKKQIKSICKLKNQEWGYGVKSQINWYNKNIKPKDIHNLFFNKSKLIGYTLLRKRTCIIKKILKKKTGGDGVISQYLYFDTLILDKRFRKKKLSDLIMSFNNTIIKQSGYFSFLICKYKLLSFYKRYGWIKLNNKGFLVKDHLFSTYGMIFNDKNYNKKNYYYYLYK
jgi:hypothetical protein